MCDIFNLAWGQQKTPISLAFDVPNSESRNIWNSTNNSKYPVNGADIMYQARLQPNLVKQNQ